MGDHPQPGPSPESALGLCPRIALSSAPVRISVSEGSNRLTEGRLDVGWKADVCQLVACCITTNVSAGTISPAPRPRANALGLYGRRHFRELEM